MSSAQVMLLLLVVLASNAQAAAIEPMLLPPLPLPLLAARQAAISAATPTTSAATIPRQVRTTTVSTTTIVQVKTTTVDTATASASSTSTESAVPTGYQLPKPFDTTLSTNFTSTACPSFLATMVADPELNDNCVAFSLLLSTSSAFFDAEKSPNTLLPYILDASCSSPTDSCTELTRSYARKIKLANTCGPDLAKGNSIAKEALDGLNNYVMLRQAGCDKDAATGQYCFAHAAAQPNATELYFYYLAEGTRLPNKATVPCTSTCTRQLLQIYSQYATNATLPISTTYPSTWNVASAACGSNFMPLVASAAVQSSTGSHRLPSPTRTLLLLFVLGLSQAL